MESELSEPVSTATNGSSDQSHLTFYSEALSHEEISSILSSSPDAQFVPDVRPPKGNSTSPYAHLKPQETYTLAVEDYVGQTDDETHRVQRISETDLSEEVRPHKEENSDPNKTSTLTSAFQMSTASDTNGNNQCLLLFDDEANEIKMSKHDVECLLRSRAAEIIAKPGKNKKSEIWTRFGRIELQGRPIKGFVACVHCRHVYVFGESGANARGTNSTSALRKHKCPLWPAASIATSIADRSFVAKTPHDIASSPYTTAVSAPATVSSRAGGSNGISVLLSANSTQIPIGVSVSTLQAQKTEQMIELDRLKVANKTTSSLALNISSSEQQEFCKQLVLLSAELGILPSQVASLDNLARLLVNLGARYSSSEVVANIQTVLQSHSLQETVATSLATGCKTRLMDELRKGPGLALSLHVATTGQVTAGCQVVLQAHSIASKTVVPLGIARLTFQQKRENLQQWMLETLLSHQLASMRRIFVCNDVEVVEECLPGENIVLCAMTDLERLVDAIFAKASDKFQQLLATVEELFFRTQVAPKAQHNAERGFYYSSPKFLWRFRSIEQFDVVAQLPPTTFELCLSLDRRLLSDVISFFAPFKEYARKLDTSGSSLHLPLLFRWQLLSHCQMKPHESDFVAQLKRTTLEIVDRDLQPHLLHHMACALHPAFKLLKKVAVSEEKKASTYDALRAYIRSPVAVPGSGTGNEEMLRKVDRDAMETALLSEKQQHDSTMFGEFGKFWDLSVAEEQGAFTLSDKDELDVYLEESVSVPDLQFSQVLNYWESRYNMLGKLSQVAKWILALPAVCCSVRTSLMFQLGQNGDAQLVLNNESLLAEAGPSPI